MTFFFKIVSVKYTVFASSSGKLIKHTTSTDLLRYKQKLERSDCMDWLISAFVVCIWLEQVLKT